MISSNFFDLLSPNIENEQSLEKSERLGKEERTVFRVKGIDEILSPEEYPESFVTNSDDLSHLED